jgi:FixJ family two-component response regulator
MVAEKPTVYIVDDDPDLLESLSMMIGSMGLNVETYTSAEAFLNSYRDSPETPKCMVLDVRLRGLSGLGLLQTLAAEGKEMPTIMMSGCADVPMAVQAMHAGALDFLEKPISSRTLSVCIREALDHCVRQQRKTSRKSELARHVKKLSSRQREVFDLLVVGQRSKEIAEQLGIGEKTVAKHRVAILGKMQVDNTVELVRLFADANLTGAVEQPHQLPGLRQQHETSRKSELARNVENLSSRQREVFDLLVAGQSFKQIARKLGIGEKTVTKHCVVVLGKMQVGNVAELVRLFADANLTGTVGQPRQLPGRRRRKRA